MKLFLINKTFYITANSKDEAVALWGELTKDSIETIDEVSEKGVVLWNGDRLDKRWKRVNRGLKG